MVDVYLDTDCVLALVKESDWLKDAVTKRLRKEKKLYISVLSVVESRLILTREENLNVALRVEKILKNKKAEKDKEDLKYCLYGLDKIEKNVTHSSQIIRGILNYARTEKDSSFRYMDIKETIDVAIDLLAVKHNLKDFRPFVKLPKKMPQVYGSPAQLSEAVFNLILDQAVKFDLKESQMPSMILILSDMEFNGCIQTPSATALKMIEEQYEQSGYKLPKLIFWNLNSRNPGNFPVQMHDKNTALVSGFSPSILVSLLDGSALDPIKVLKKTIGQDRYDEVRI